MSTEYIENLYYLFKKYMHLQQQSLQNLLYIQKMILNYLQQRLRHICWNYDDTKNFTFKTGVRTFAAAYLRRCGVDIMRKKCPK